MPITLPDPIRHRKTRSYGFTRFGMRQYHSGGAAIPQRRELDGVRAAAIESLACFSIRRTWSLRLEEHLAELGPPALPLRDRCNNDRLIRQPIPIGRCVRAACVRKRHPVCNGSNSISGDRSWNSVMQAKRLHRVVTGRIADRDSRPHLPNNSSRTSPKSTSGRSARLSSAASRSTTRGNAAVPPRSC